jgi:hypothetical protein
MKRFLRIGYQIMPSLRTFGLPQEIPDSGYSFIPILVTLTETKPSFPARCLNGGFPS